MTTAGPEGCEERVEGVGKWNGLGVYFGETLGVKLLTNDSSKYMHIQKFVIDLGGGVWGIVSRENGYSTALRDIVLPTVVGWEVRVILRASKRETARAERKISRYSWS